MTCYVVTSDVLTAIEVLCARSEAALRGSGLTATQYRVLLLLETHQSGLRRIDCARELSVSPATAGAAAADLEAKRLITLNEGESRSGSASSPLLISVKGSGLLSQVSRRLESEYDDLLIDLTPEHKGSFYTIFMLSSLGFGLPRFHPDTGSYDYEAALCSVFLANKTFITEITHHHGLSWAQYRVLYEVLCNPGEPKMGRIGNRLLLKPANLAIACSKLASLGLVELEASRLDRRTKKPVLTKAGERLAHTIAARVDEACVSRNRHLRPEETSVTTKACALIVARQQRLRKSKKTSGRDGERLG